MIATGEFMLSFYVALHFDKEKEDAKVQWSVPVRLLLPKMLCPSVDLWPTLPHSIIALGIELRS